MRKKVLTIFCALIFALLLCGCTANVGYGISYAPNEDGTYGITQSVYVTIDKASISSAGKTTQDFYSNFQLLCNSYVSALKNSFNVQCQKERDQEIETGSSKKVKNLGGEEATAQKLYDYVYAHMKPIKFDSEQNDNWFAVSMEQNFDTILAYKCFWSMLDVESDGSDVDMGEVVDQTFYKKTIYVQHTVFNGLTEENFENLDLATKTIVANIKTFFNNEYNLDNKDLTYTFSLATPQAHFYTDADKAGSDDNGNTVYVWEFSSAGLKAENGDQITTWTIAYKTANWYQLAIYVTIIFGVGLLFVATIKSEKKNLKK